MKAFRVIWRAIRLVYEDLLLYVVLSALWWLGAAPLLFAVYAFFQALGTGLALWWAGVLLGILLSPLSSAATVGLHRVANRAANYRRIGSSFFWEGARRYLLKGWILYVGNGLLVAGVLFNTRFYLASAPLWMRVIGIAWIWALLLVLMLGQYTFPLLWQQDEPHLGLILRNALILAMRSPLYSFILLVYQLLVIVASVIFPLLLFLITPALIAVTANVALVTLLQEMGLAPPPPE